MLCARQPRRLTYVSCHPAALARDLKILSAAFSIEKLILIDLFPQTGHMEVVAQLVGL
jgi:23S rRNA (uracil1939-C5)-methyltransferase